MSTGDGEQVETIRPVGNTRGGMRAVYDFKIKQEATRQQHNLISGTRHDIFLNITQKMMAFGMVGIILDTSPLPLFALFVKKYRRDKPGF